MDDPQIVYAAWATAAFTCVIALTGIAALRYAKKQLAQAQEATKVQHLMSFVSQFDQEPFVSTRRGLAEKRLKGDSYPHQLEALLNFFEMIALLVERDYLDVHDVWSAFSYWMLHVFADARDEIEQEQKDDPTYLSDFVELVKQLQAIEKEKHGLIDRPSKDDLAAFWQEEANLTSGVPVRRRRIPRKKQGSRAGS